MSHETNVLQHLIRFVRGTVADVVGRESGPSAPSRASKSALTFSCVVPSKTWRC